MILRKNETHLLSEVNLKLGTEIPYQAMYNSLPSLATYLDNN